MNTEIPETIKSIADKYYDCDVEERRNRRYSVWFQKKSGYEYRYSSRLFKSYYNVTIKRYLLEKKIEISMSMIREGKKIEDIIYDMQFDNLTHFCSAFKKITGKTIKQYKNELDGHN